MAKSYVDGQMLYKYYIEENQLKVIDGVLETRRNKKWVAFGYDDIPDEPFPGYRNVERVWKGGEILWLDKRDDELAKKLFTTYHVDVIKDLQKQIDGVGDRISMIRGGNIVLGTTAPRSKCFDSDGVKTGVLSKMEEGRRQHQENWDCSEFINANQYADRKITMLKNEMFIDLSAEDELHIRGLTSRGAIDACVRAMINKYWG